MADNLFRRLAAAMGQPELGRQIRASPRHADRNEHHDALDEIIGRLDAAHPLAELEAILQKAAVPATRIFTIEDIFNDPHYRARNSIVAAPDDSNGQRRHGGRRAAAVGDAGRRAPCRPRRRPGHARGAARRARAERCEHRRARSARVIADEAARERERLHERERPSHGIHGTVRRRTPGRTATRPSAPRRSPWAGRRSSRAARPRACSTRASASMCWSMPGTFIESGLFGTSATRPEDRDSSPADGKIAGFGKIDGRECAIVVNDFTVMGASSSATNGRKIGHMKRVATSRGMPMVFLGESSGARMPDHMGSRGMGSLLGNDGTQYVRMRETPWASATLGLSYGSSSWYAVLSDFSVMRKGAVLAVSSPQLASLAIKEKVDPEELGGWQVHAEVTGFADAGRRHRRGGDRRDQDLPVLPARATTTKRRPSVRGAAGSGEAMAGIAKLLPEKRTQVYDVRNIIRTIVDTDSFFELKARFGKVAVTGLARLGGSTVGIRRQQSAVQGRRDGHRRLREGHELPRAVRQLQHPDRAARRHARASRSASRPSASARRARS